MWNIQIKTGRDPITGVDVWETVGPVGMPPYQFNTQEEAEGMLCVRYPNQVDSFNSGGPQTVRVKKAPRPVYDIAVILSIPATSYQEAMSIAHGIGDAIAIDASMGVDVVMDYQHDKQGQRVVYLHPEE